MDEQIDKLDSDHRVEAGRGVPLDKQAEQEHEEMANEIKDSDKEPLDERIRKAGI